MLLLSVLQSKDRLVSRIKNETQPFVAYKQCEGLAKTNTGLRWKDRKKTFQANEVQKQAEYLAKQTSKQWRGSLRQGEKSFARHSSDKGLISRVYEELKK
jgi:hypothetical protein